MKDKNEKKWIIRLRVDITPLRWYIIPKSTGLENYGLYKWLRNKNNQGLVNVSWCFMCFDVQLYRGLGKPST